VFSNSTILNLKGIRTAILLATAAMGCNSSKFEFAPVKGQVLLDGKPVDQAKIVFMPSTVREDGESGPYSQGLTDAEGRFALETVEPSPRTGAVVGPHRIIVSTKQARLDPEVLDREIIDVPESIPWEYTYYKRTPLKYEVPRGGTNSADFAIVTSGQ
jgi:hypothetical protein